MMMRYSAAMTSTTYRWSVWRKIAEMMKHSALVLAGNNYLSDCAARSAAAQLEIVPTVVNLSRYEPVEKEAESCEAVVGWIGTPSTWSEFGRRLFDQTSKVLGTYNARFRAVGAAPERFSTDQLDMVPWREETEVSEIQKMDIGVMLLTDTPWARGKCGYKLIQYMACGLPVVASPVGVNSQIVEHEVNGFHASTKEEWNEAITTLLNDRELRQKMGREGRRKAERDYSLQLWGPRVAHLLRDVMNKHNAN